MEQLPDNFDIVVVGTGMPECIIAAAAARVGKTVLHIDRNGYYGGNWASFNFEQFIQWIEVQKDICTTVPADRMMEVTWLEQLDDSERLVMCPKCVPTVSSIIQRTFVRDRPSPENVATCNTAEDRSTSEESVQESKETTDAPNGLASSEEQSGSSASTAVEDETILSSTSAETNDSRVPLEPPQKEWFMQDLEENRRKFNVDLLPKLMFSRGSMVELLISSNIARYAEFQSVNRILTHIDGHLEQVPCSRADVFSTKNVSVVEKRMLMKLLTFCAEFQQHPEEYRGFEGVPFIEFLRSRKLSSNIEHYVLHAIAMVDESCPTLQGLKATQKFMDSLGRYGNSPFLWTCYGSGELPQCFCRLCAVFGGIYYLKRDVDAVILNSDNECKGIIMHGKKIKCPSLVMEYSYSPLRYVPAIEAPKFVSRAVYITDSSLFPGERQQNTLLRLPPTKEVPSATTVLEFGSLSFICPNDLYLVHMICESHGDNIEQEFSFAKELLNFNVGDDGGKEDTECEKVKPKVLWSAFFRQQDTTSTDLNANLPKGLYLTSSPGGDQDYEYAVKEAKEIFYKLYPDDEFLPRAPEPEDIVMEEQSNPGDHGDTTEETNTDSPTTETKTDSPITETKTDLPITETKTELPITETKTDSSITETKTDLPIIKTETVMASASGDSNIAESVHQLLNSNISQSNVSNSIECPDTSHT